MYAEAYLEPIRTSMVEFIFKNHKKVLLYMFEHSHKKRKNSRETRAVFS